MVVDLRLAFGWLGSPGFFYRWAKALVEFVMKKAPADVTDEIKTALGEWALHQSIEEPGTFPIFHPTRDPAAGASTVSAEKNDPFYFIKAYLDDTVLIEHNVDDRPRKLGQLVIYAHFLLYGFPREGRPACLKKEKVTDWVSVGEVLGILVDLNKMVLSLPPKKLEEMRALICDEWAPSRTTATPRQVMVLVGKLRSWSMCVRHGQYFLRRIMDAIGGRWHKRQLDKPFTLKSRGLQEDLNVWRSLLSKPKLLETNFASPLYNHIKRAPELLAISDACQAAGGGYVAPLGVYWQYVWPAEVQRRLALTANKLAPAGETLTISHLELAALLLGIAVMVEQAKIQGWELDGKAVLALADNTNAVAWVRKAGARDKRAAALMRLLGLEEIENGFSSLAKHLPGINNSVADFISRSHAHSHNSYMLTVPCPLTSQPISWSQVLPPLSWLERVKQVLLSTTPTEL